MYSIFPIRSVRAVMSFHRKWMRLLPLYSSAELNICPCLPFHWKISEDWINSRLEINNNNIKNKKNAAFYTLLKRKHTWVLAYPAILRHSIHLHLPGTPDELGDDHWMLLENKGSIFFHDLIKTEQGCNISSWTQTVGFSEKNRGYYTNELMEF